jgi:hypothetical protein
MEKVPLLENTLALLKKCDLPLKRISDMSGVEYEWLKRLARLEIPNPGVKHVQTLHDFLVEQIET